MARTNLSLGGLYRAVSGSTRTNQAVSISGLNGGGTNINFLGFATDAITVTPPTYTYIVESTTENAQFSFSQTGSQFYNKVQKQLNNYTCSFDNANFSTGSVTHTTGPAIFPMTPAAIAQSTYSEAQSVLTMKYEDGYNINATNHAAVTTKTLYAVDVYNTINQPDFCLLFGTQIELSDGSTINVEDLNVGDELRAWVPAGLPDETLDGTETQSTEWRFYFLDTLEGSFQNVIIRDIVYNFAPEYFSINNGTIKGTATHPLYVWDSEIEKYRFKNLDSIIIGDRLIKEDQTEEEVYSSIKIIEDVEIVTINVENADVFISNGLISHNKGTTTQPYIPSVGLKMYLEPYKTASFAAGSLPASGYPTVDFLDLSGNNTGVRPGAEAPLSRPSGDPYFTNSAIRKNCCYTFDGANSILYKDKDSNINGGYTNFNTNTGTIHIWVRPTTSLAASSRYIFDYAGFYGIAIESTDNNTVNRLQFYGSSLGNSGQKTIAFTFGIWYLVSVTFQPSGICTLYVDGSSVGSYTSAAFSAPVSTNYLTIGANSARTSFWNGDVGPVLFYNTLQSSTLVGQVYNYFSPSYK